MDDQAVFRRVAREVIEATEGFESLGEAASGVDGLALADALRPDLVLVDVRMPGIDGLETARRLSVAHPESIVVLISTEDLVTTPFGTGCEAAAFVPKERFCPAMLRALWAEHGPTRSPPADLR